MGKSKENFQVEDELLEEKPFNVDELEVEAKIENQVKPKPKKIEKDKNIKVKKRRKKDNDSISRYEAEPTVGLSKSIIEERIEQGLTNETKKGSSKSIKRIIFKNIFTFFNILTLAIAGWLISINAFTDLFFLVIVTANVVIGIIQEIKAKNTIDKLSLISAPTAFVIRDSIKSEIKISNVVLDDILVLEAGKQIPADSVVLSGTVEVNESLLTGESDAIVKKPGDTLFSGSFVISGTCYARVDKVGENNYISQLTNEAKVYKKPKSDLLKSLNLIIVVMALIIIPIGAVLFMMQMHQGGADYATAVRKTAGAMIGMIPSGLYLLSSVALAVGVIRLAQNNVMVQDLYCIEMLARVNVLCLDKTGTITDGTMSVKNVIEYNSISGLSTKNIVSAMLNALTDSNLTSVALEEKFGRSKRFKFNGTIPFSSQRKYNAVSFERYGTFALGAPEFVLKEDYIKVQKEVEQYAKQGYRVLVLAHKDGFIVDGKLPSSSTTLVSLILIEDNIRPDAINTINYFKQSGVEVKVISGDNPLTVSKISERAGIENATHYISLDGLQDEEVIRAATKYTVFGRVSPAQKKLLVKTLKNAGKTVAMTGDGVNDILALREADCSIAVASGSEAARNVSHLVLLDSNFDSMPKVVAEGRRVINNVSKVACLFLTKTIFSFLLSIQAINSGGVYPISTNQLMMIDFLVTGMPSFFLVLEPNNKLVEGKFIKNVLKGALPGAITILIGSMIAFALVDYLGLDFLTSSTIIVLLATHTCLMVLYKVCKPFNTLHKLIFGTSYALFVLITIFMPNFLEFRPIFKFAEYHSDKVEIKTLASTPRVEISESWYYVIDGMMTDVSRNINETGYNFSSEDGYLTINGKKTNYLLSNDIDELNISTKNNELYFGGYITDLIDITKNNQNMEIELLVAGDSTVEVYSFDKITSERKKLIYTNPYKIISDISVSDNNLYVNGENTNLKIYEEIQNFGIKEENGELYLVINNSIFEYNAQRYKFNKPFYTTNRFNNIVINPSVAYNMEIPGHSKPINIVDDLGYTNFDDFIAFSGISSDDPDMRKQMINTSGNYYEVRKKAEEKFIKTSVEIIVPSVEVSKSGYYVIDGYYTDYVAQQYGGDSSTVLNFTKEGYLTINGLETNYKVEIKTQMGGQVLKLSVPAVLTLVSLMLFATPMMRILQELVPWLKSAIKYIQNLLSKF